MLDIFFSVYIQCHSPILRDNIVYTKENIDMHEPEVVAFCCSE